MQYRHVMKHGKSRAHPLYYPQSLRTSRTARLHLYAGSLFFSQIIIYFLDIWLVATPKWFFMCSSSSYTCVNFVKVMPKYRRQVLLILIYYCKQLTLFSGNVTVSPCQQTPVSSTSVDESIGMLTSFSDSPQHTRTDIA
jgi:hypothetical protein